MEHTILNFLHQLEESGKLHDKLEPEHAEKYLNLEPETAETVVLLLKIAGVRSLLEIGTSNGYRTIWIAATVAPVGGRIVTIERNSEKRWQAADNLASLDRFSSAGISTISFCPSGSVRTSTIHQFLSCEIYCCN